MPVTVYSTSWDTNADGWTGTSVARGTTSPRSGAGQLQFTGAFGQSRKAVKTLTGLTVGQTYTFTVYGRDNNVTAPSGRIGVTGIGVSAAVALSNSAYTLLTYVFTATATSHELYIETASTFQGSHAHYYDDVLVTEPDPPAVEQKIAVGSDLLDGVDDIRIGTDTVSRIYVGSTLVYGG